MKYRIIGADGKTYGPTSLEQIRRWVAEGRADNRTPVFVEGASNWTYLGLLPELAGAVPAASPAPIAALPGAAPNRGTNGMAIAGLICGVCSWMPLCCCVPVNLLGIIFSIVALLQISSQSQPQEGRVLAIIGLVLSALSIILGLAIFVIQLAFASAPFNWNAGQF